VDAKAEDGERMSALSGDPSVPVAAVGARERAPAQGPVWVEVARGALGLGRTRVGLVLATVVVVIALVGPIVSPHSPTAFVGPPYAGPSHGLPFGTDGLGRDTLSRFLCGGRVVLGISLLATIIGVVAGAAIGLLAGYGRGWLDETLMRSLDVVLAFPPIILPMLALSVLGNKWWLLAITIGALHTPYVARIIRGATLQVIGQDFIKYTEAVGVPRRQILFGDILPNVTAPLLVDAAIRMTYSIATVAALAYLGLGPQPPAPDWGTMINENQAGIALNAWPVVLPILAIGCLTIGLSLVADGLGQTLAGIDRRLTAEVDGSGGGGQ
jgi:peptide/nickel transport system permease protein